MKVLLGLYVGILPHLDAMLGSEWALAVHLVLIISCVGLAGAVLGLKPYVHTFDNLSLFCSLLAIAFGVLLYISGNQVPVLAPYMVGVVVLLAAVPLGLALGATLFIVFFAFRRLWQERRQSPALTGSILGWARQQGRNSRRSSQHSRLPNEESSDEYPEAESASGYATTVVLQGCEEGMTVDLPGQSGPAVIQTKLELEAGQVTHLPDEGDTPRVHVPISLLFPATVERRDPRGSLLKQAESDKASWRARESVTPLAALVAEGSSSQEGKGILIYADNMHNGNMDWRTAVRDFFSSTGDTQRSLAKAAEEVIESFTGDGPSDGSGQALPVVVVVPRKGVVLNNSSSDSRVGNRISPQV